MLYDTRTLAFICELYHPPMQQMDAARIQSIHGELFTNPRLGYRNFNITPTGIVLSNPLPAPGANQSFCLMADRMRISEEFTGIPIEDFIQKLETFARKFVERMEVPVFTAVQVSIRSLVNSRQFRDAREFMERGIMRFSSDDLAVFGRPTPTIGLRLMFSPGEGHRGFHALRIESWNNDPRSVYLENVATFPGAVVPADLSPISTCVHETYQFLTVQGVEFIERFDRATQF